MLKKLSSRIYSKTVGGGIKCNCPHRYRTGKKSSNYYSGLDWLQLGVKLNENVAMSEYGSDILKGKYRFVLRETGTQHYRFCYDIYIGQLQYFVLELTPRRDNSNGKNDNCGIIKLENWLLYSDWREALQEFRENFIGEVTTISRLDICFDGLNHVYHLMRAWQNKKSDAYGVKLIGKSDISAHKIDRKTRDPKGYTIGNPKGLKNISIYNKTKDIQRLSKNYIMHRWKQFGLDTNKVHYRVEMRLKWGYLSTLQNPEKPCKRKQEINVKGVKKKVLIDSFEYYTADELLNKLLDIDGDSYMHDVFKTALRGFFEWVIPNPEDKNVSRWERLELFPTEYRNTLMRQHKEYNGTSYKAKMQVHNTYFQVAKEIIGPLEGIARIKEQLSIYELHDWYNVRVNDFRRRYKPEDSVMLALAYCGMPEESVSSQRIKKILRERGALLRKNQRIEPTDINPYPFHIRSYGWTMDLLFDGSNVVEERPHDVGTKERVKRK